jgi:hypothetical protein
MSLTELDGLVRYTEEWLHENGYKSPFFILKIKKKTERNTNL